jgi:hypothetical protein
MCTAVRFRPSPQNNLVYSRILIFKLDFVCICDIIVEVNSQHKNSNQKRKTTEKMKVPIEFINEDDSLVYTGTIEINDRTYDWTLNLSVPVPEILSQEAPTERKEEAMKLFRFTINLDEKEIEITDILFMFLVSTVAHLILDSYKEVQRTVSFSKKLIQLMAGRTLTEPAMNSHATSYEIPEDKVPEELRVV